MDNDPLLLERLRAEQEAVEARVRAAEQALETARRNVARQWALFQEGIASRRQYEEAQLREAEVARELATARAELVRIETRVVRQAQQLVTAPQDGIILRRAPGRGSVFVRMGDELAVLVPDTVSRAVELWVDGNDIPLIQVGREVRVQFEGWPAIQISGWPALAVGTFGGRVVVIDPSEAGTPGTFRILVLPMEGERWPDPRFLRQGVRAHGWVLLNVVPLGFELWRQFNDFPPAMPEPLRQQAQQSGAPDAAKGGTGPKGP
jgi:multidrug efflux pump subunit AcrA (membrane-fusion protein)